MVSEHSIVSENVRQSVPFLLLMINFKVQVIVHEILLIVFGVLIRFEVRRAVFYLVSLPMPSRGPLFIFKTIFFFCCKDHVTVL